MPPQVDSLSQLLLLVAGGILYWLGGVIKETIKRKTSERRNEVDRIARLERELWDAREAIQGYRAVMLDSGHWTPDTLPEFRKTRSGKNPTV